MLLRVQPVLRAPMTTDTFSARQQVRIYGPLSFLTILYYQLHLKLQPVSGRRGASGPAALIHVEAEVSPEQGPALEDHVWEMTRRLQPATLIPAQVL